MQGIWPSFFLSFLNQRDLIIIRGAKKTGDICFEKLLLLCVSINEINIEEKNEFRAIIFTVHRIKTDQMKIV